MRTSQTFHRPRAMGENVHAESGSEKANTPAEGSRCPIVGIGASAGVLEALKRFRVAMPADSDTAFVLIQYLDTNHESLTAEILTRCTAIPVEVNRLYVIPVWSKTHTARR